MNYSVGQYAKRVKRRVRRTGVDPPTCRVLASAEQNRLSPRYDATVQRSMITLEKEELIHGAQLGPERAIIASALPTMQRRLGERPLILLLELHCHMERP